jgi:poly(A) polymerase
VDSDRIRPELTGEEIMRVLGITPGQLVGKAWNHLLELQLEQGALGKERATAELAAWAERQGIALPEA